MRRRRTPRLVLPPEVSAGGLVVRPFQLEDVPSFHAAVLDNVDHLLPFMTWAANEPVPLEERYALVERWRALAERGEAWECGLFLAGAVAGAAGLAQHDDVGVVEIGYWVHRCFTRRGLATLAAHLLTTTAFETPHVTAVEIRHDRANLASSRVPRRLGFTYLGETSGRDEGGRDGTGVVGVWRVRRSAWTERRVPPPLIVPAG